MAAQPDTQTPPRGRGPLAPLCDFLTAVTGPWTRDNAWSWFKIIVAVLLIRWLWFEPFTIPSGSMEPTLHGDPRFLRGDRVAVNKFVYGPRVPFMDKRLFHLRSPERWDIVVFNSPAPDAQYKILIKRIVGLPGERIRIADGKIHVNGEPLDLPPHMPPDTYYTAGRGGLAMLSGAMRYGIDPRDEYSLIPPGHYLMLGDNSANSQDGRYFGWVPEENIIGRTFCIWWPIARRRDFTGFTSTPWGMGLLYGLPVAFLLYGVVTASFFQSWRVRRSPMPDMPRPGERIIVNRMAFGLRIPGIRGRLTSGRSPRCGEVIMYHLTRHEHEDGALEIGRVAAAAGRRVQLTDGTVSLDGPGGPVARPAFSPEELDAGGAIPPRCVVALTADGDDALRADLVHHEDLYGSVASVWWPLRRARRIHEG